MPRQQQEEDVVPGAPSLEEMKNSFVRAFMLLRTKLGDDPREPEFMTDEELGALEVAFKTSCEQIDRTENETLTYSECGKEVYDRYLGFLNVEAPSFEQIDMKEQEFWMHLMRHMQNVCAYDPDEDGDMQRHEGNMADRFADVLKMKEK